MIPRHMNTSIGLFESIYVYRGGLYDPEDPVDEDSSGEDEPLPFEDDDALGIHSQLYFLVSNLISFYCFFISNGT